ncbi:MAG: UxaA family hydrolase [Actinobacteria bacterium]|jgi:altronate hydrolase|nr:UxaA family hydrolase [Actinomycetota bacterium]
MRKLLILNKHDNIAVVLTDLAIGDEINESGFAIKVLNMIPRGHKIATKDISKDDGIVKYGERMGHATTQIKVGEHVHTHNVLGDRLSVEQVSK